MPVSQPMPAVPTSARDLVSIQPDAIVSRQLVKGAGGGVTLFAFDAGQSLSEHTAPFDALAFALEGSAEITLCGTAHELGEGEVLLMPANDPHGLRALTPFKMLLSMIRP